MKPIIRSFYHRPTFTWSHIVYADNQNQAMVIDPVLDYSQANGKVSHESITEIIEFLDYKGLTLKYILETHAHADHITAANYLKSRCVGAIVGIGQGIKQVQKAFKKVFNLEELSADGSQFDLLIEDRQVLEFGDLKVQAIYTPGHTNDSMSYMIGDCIFIGDTLFAPEYGTARCDFPGGDSGKLYDSIQKIFALGDDKKLYLCHDYPKHGRAPQAWFSSRQQQVNNIHLNHTVSKQKFVKLRETRDNSLSVPSLILPSVQVNITAGQLPKIESNGVSYLKIPLSF